MSHESARAPQGASGASPRAALVARQPIDDDPATQHVPSRDAPGRAEPTQPSSRSNEVVRLLENWGPPRLVAAWGTAPRTRAAAASALPADADPASTMARHAPPEHGLRSDRWLEHLVDALTDIVANRATEPFLVWLDSGATGLQAGRSSIVAAFPQAVVQANTPEEVPVLLESIDLWNDATAASPATREPGGPSPALPAPGPHGTFSGGWMGFLAYEAAAGLEPALLRFAPPQTDARLPLAAWALFPTWFSWDHDHDRLELWTRLPVSHSDDATVPGLRGVELPGLTAWRHWGMGAERSVLDRTTPMLRPRPRLQHRSNRSSSDVQRLVDDSERSFGPSGFRHAVSEVQHAIREGEIFQANIAHRMTVRTNAHPLAAYIQIRRLNPSPFAAYFETPWGTIVSNSPERLVSMRAQACQPDAEAHRDDGSAEPVPGACARLARAGAILNARPIAGTAPRCTDDLDDDRSRRALLHSPKERAEHTMLVDLLRNDLGRVCCPGTVRVSDYHRLEPYSHVHHMVSDVVGVASPEADLVDILRALFPGGTITGAPKLRGIEVIHQVEPVPRGAYTGSLGYINTDGSLDLNILIRTLLFREGQAHLYAGAGIVADSDPDSEYRETLDKAQAMLHAIGATLEEAP